MDITKYKLTILKHAALIYDAADESGKALELYQQVLEITPNDKQALDAIVRISDNP